LHYCHSVIAFLYEFLVYCNLEPIFVVLTAASYDVIHLTRCAIFLGLSMQNGGRCWRIQLMEEFGISTIESAVSVNVAWLKISTKLVSACLAKSFFSYHWSKFKRAHGHL